MKVKIPGVFEKVVKATEEKVLAACPEIQALVVIGSVAIGDYSQDSDLDLVCIVEGKLDRKHKDGLIHLAPEGVQLVPFSQEELKKHFAKRTTMAHSIRRGIVVFQRDEFLQPYLEGPLGPPSRSWMKEWFVHWLEFYFMGLMDFEREKEFHRKYCQEECYCHISDNLARAAVNFSILFLDAQGVIPASKGEIRKGASERASQEVFEGVDAALQVCHEDRDMSYDEAGKIEKTARWLKEKLIAELSVSEDDMARPLKLYELLKSVKNRSQS